MNLVVRGDGEMEAGKRGQLEVIILTNRGERLSAERARSNYTGGKKRREEMESDCLGDP